MAHDIAKAERFLDMNGRKITIWRPMPRPPMAYDVEYLQNTSAGKKLK
jgi:hypothetical protein